MIKLTLDTMKKAWPNGDKKVPGLRQGIADKSEEVFEKWGIDTPMALAHLMAQLSHECGEGLFVIESLKYTAKRMTQVWPRRFPTIASAEPYAMNERALGNKTYNGRMGNRPGTDDGYNFRGRGAVQTTGREAYEKLGEIMGLDLINNPDLLIDPDYFLEAGVADFVAICKCLEPARNNDITTVTKRLNGGFVGFEERKAQLRKWKGLLGV